MKKRVLTGAILAALVATVGAFEGLRTNAYLDGGGVATICYGETKGVKLGDKKTVDECKAMFKTRLAEFAGKVDACLVAPVPDGAYVAFTSLAYNIGTGAFCKSTLVRKANAGDLQGACDQLLVWNKDNGKVVPGLSKRRGEEREMCLASLK